MQADLAQREQFNAEELKQSLKQIGRSSMRATHTVNQLLALARAESSGKALVLQRCDLAALTVDAVRDTVPRAMDKHMDLGYDGAQPGSRGVVLEGNPTLLKEMIRNLLDNAVAYTPSTPQQPGVITARVLADPFGRVLVLQVEDTGPGIPESERELVFQPFYRSIDTNVDGSGLGLPIVQEIARQHKAQITDRGCSARASAAGDAGERAFRGGCGRHGARPRRRSGSLVEVQLQALALHCPLHRRQLRHLLHVRPQRLEAGRVDLREATPAQQGQRIGIERPEAGRRPGRGWPWAAAFCAIASISPSRPHTPWH
jgi:hypothetical protein